MRHLALILLLLAPAAAVAKEEGGTDCGLYAVLRGDDKGDVDIYDGVRLGLELARLPRVCREEIAPWPQGLRKFVEKLTVDRKPGHAAGPLFAIGDEACEALAALETDLPRVLVVQRYTVEREPLRATPTAPGAALVYADLGAERIRRILADMLAVKRPVGYWAESAERGDVTLETKSRLDNALGLSATGVTPEIVKGAKGRLLLHLRHGLGGRPWDYAQAVARAREWRIPLVSDDRGRFGQGAVVTLVARHELVGRAAADAGRRLRSNPKLELPPRAITGVEVWVDLRAADEQGIELPLAFLARADKLKRGRAAR